MIDYARFEKYAIQAPRYTSYPPANYFAGPVPDDLYLKVVEESNFIGPKNVSLYFHIPFCPHRCLFCGCQTEIGKGAQAIQRYFRALHQDVDSILPSIDPSRPLTQIHFGGGTPNAVPYKLLSEVLHKIKAHFKNNWNEHTEVAIECDPSLLHAGRLTELAQMGFNRVSFGIQDSNAEILDIVERRPSKIALNELVELSHQVGFKSVNFDLIYGLPGQTIEQFGQTILEIVKAKPDRIACFGYAHVPWFKEQQTKLEDKPFPTPPERLQMLTQTVQALTESGYLFIGFDHFALPHDSLAHSLEQKTLKRNFQGYCTQEHTGQVYGFGASAISQLHDGYYHNIKTSEIYVDLIENQKPILEKFYRLNADERLIKDLIEDILCNQRIDIVGLAQKHNIETLELYKKIYSDLNTPEAFDPTGEFYTLTEQELKLTDLGRWISRTIAQKLDPMAKAGSNKSFSQAV